MNVLILSLKAILAPLFFFLLLYVKDRSLLLSDFSHFAFALDSILSHILSLSSFPPTILIFTHATNYSHQRINTALEVPLT